ncbi:hypothetical protein PWG71_18830 [Nocardiopsis sp. N85]|uniref:hypothetical protein n=1 Tax=Nocardiopsis sp. N85 TaxID=3029400 RepID=UPI00237EEE71|nr:hypothetical protein [Nocardiopsis sp. N85]MDE3723452.1 hypothetical protein [Nocardiopsis sp. N85]
MDRDIRTDSGRPSTAHTAHAEITPVGRLASARRLVEDGRPPRRAAERFRVGPTTAQR